MGGQAVYFYADIFNAVYVFEAHALLNPEDHFSFWKNDRIVMNVLLDCFDGVAFTQPSAVRFSHFDVQCVCNFRGGLAAGGDEAPEVGHFIVCGMPKAQLHLVESAIRNIGSEFNNIVSVPGFLWYILVSFEYGRGLASCIQEEKEGYDVFFHV